MSHRGYGALVASAAAAVVLVLLGTRPRLDEQPAIARGETGTTSDQTRLAPARDDDSRITAPGATSPTGPAEEVGTRRAEPSALLGTLWVRVLDPEGTPEPGATVAYAPSSSSSEPLPPGTAAPEPRRLSAGADGELRLRVAPGIVQVSAWTGTAATGDVFHEVDPAREVPLDLELIPVVALEGTVVNAVTAAPVAGAQVWVETFDDLSHALSDADGRYRLERFPVGSGGGFVRCRSARHGTESKGLTVREDGSWRVDVPGRGARIGDLQAGPPFRLDFELVPARAIVGEVRGPRGQLLAGAQVHAQGYFWIARDIALTDEATAETDERGRFELTSLRTDVSHTVRLEADGFAVQRRLVPPGSEPVSDLGTIVMAWGGELLVAVISFEGLPVEGCLLALRPVAPGIEAEGASPDDEDSPRDVDIDAEAWPRDADITGTPPMVPTDSDGMASFDGLSAGAYQLEVRVDGGPPIRREVELLPPPGVTQVLVELPLEYMTIEGEVLRDGEPVPGVEIRVRGRTNRSTTSDSRGRFILAGNDSTVRWHSLRARWTDADGTVWATKVEIELDRPRFVRLELLPLAEDPDAR